MIEGIVQDLRHGARMLVKNPGFTLIAIASIAIGVGANAAMFSLADGLVLRPLPVPRADQVVSVSATAPRANETFFLPSNRLSHLDYTDLRDRAQSFSGLAAYTLSFASFAAGRDQAAQSKLGLAVSGNFFDVLELQPALGRAIRPDEDRVPGRDAVVVLAYSTWAEQFGSDPGIVGRQVRLGGLDFTVVGVAPESFTGMHLVLPPAFIIPIAMQSKLAGAVPATLLEQRNFRYLEVRGRIKSGVSLEQARQEVASIARGLEQTYPDTNLNFGMLVRTAFEARLDERGASAPSAFMLMTLAFAVLLVACANVAGLLMSRAPAREKEMALRLAIGGARWRITRQVITESVLLAAGGGALGLAMGYGGVMLLRRLPIISDIGVRLTFNLDHRAIAVGLVLAAASALLSSLVPAWRASHATNLALTLRSGTSHAQRLSGLWGRNGLVTAQVALALVLLTVTVYLGRAFRAELGEPGFRTEGMLLAGFDPRLAGYDSARTEAFYRQLSERVKALPGVTSVGMTSIVPLNQDNREPLAIVPEGFQLPRDTNSLTILSARIDEGYLATMGIPLVMGRGFASSDTTDTPRVVLINRAMAARYWPEQNPIGKRVRLIDRQNQPWAEVVGVTADNKYNWIGEGPTPWLYLPQTQDVGSRSTLIVASPGAAVALAGPIRDIVEDIDPNMPISSVRTMEDFYYGNASGLVYALTSVVGTMGLLGLSLALVGLYGLVAYSAARRTREIGIRMAIGAPSATVLRMVLRHGFALATAGVVAGVIGSVVVGGLIRSVFPNAGLIDFTTYLLVVPVLVAITMLAAWVPARRAARIDPLVALRQE
jgi:macrolide transport system ATP-binding/permease protein